MSTVQVDTINESTTGSGVTIDGVLIKDSKLASGTGNVLQVVQGTLASQADTTSSTFADTGLSATITPSATSSKILVMVMHHIYAYTTGFIPAGEIKLFRGTTEIDTPSRNILKADDHPSDNNIYFLVNGNITYLDSPNTTSATTYKTQFAELSDGTFSVANSDHIDTMVLMEVGG